MKEKIYEKIINEIWGKIISIPILLIVSALFEIGMFNKFTELFGILIENNGLVYRQVSQKTVLLAVATAVCLLGLNGLYIYVVVSKLYIKKAHSNNAGILIYLNTLNRDIYEDTVRKFGDEFKRRINPEFEVIFVPFGRKITFSREGEKLTKFLQKKRCLLFLRLDINTDKSDQSIIYDFILDATIIHIRYKDIIEQQFKREFSEVLSGVRNISFESKDMIKKLRVTASEISIGCDYIIGLSLFLNGNFEKAENILGPLSAKLPTEGKWQRIGFSVCKIRYEMFMTIGSIYLEYYQRNCENIDALDKLDICLEKANACLRNTYDYYLNKAYWCVAKEQDSESAKKYINICKQMKHKSKVWMYSDAFLKAYDNKSFSCIHSSYSKALKIEYNTLELIQFIEMILYKEPNRIGLYLALGILYDYLGDEELKKTNIDRYISCSNDKEKIEDMLVKKGLISA